MDEVLVESEVVLDALVAVGNNLWVGTGVDILFGFKVFVGDAGELMGNVAVASGVGKSEMSGGITREPAQNSPMMSPAKPVNFRKGST